MVYESLPAESAESSPYAPKTNFEVSVATLSLCLAASLLVSTNSVLQHVSALSANGHLSWFIFIPAAITFIVSYASSFPGSQADERVIGFVQTLAYIGIAAIIILVSPFSPLFVHKLDAGRRAATELLANSYFTLIVAIVAPQPFMVFLRQGPVKAQSFDQNKPKD